MSPLIQRELADVTAFRTGRFTVVTDKKGMIITGGVNQQMHEVKNKQTEAYIQFFMELPDPTVFVRENFLPWLDDVVRTANLAQIHPFPCGMYGCVMDAHLVSKWVYGSPLKEMMEIGKKSIGVSRFSKGEIHGLMFNLQKGLRIVITGMDGEMPATNYRDHEEAVVAG